VIDLSDWEDSDATDKQMEISAENHSLPGMPLDSLPKYWHGANIFYAAIPGTHLSMPPPGQETAANPHHAVDHDESSLAGMLNLCLTRPSSLITSR